MPCDCPPPWQCGQRGLSATRALTVLTASSSTVVCVSVSTTARRCRGVRSPNRARTCLPALCRPPGLRYGPDEGHQQQALTEPSFFRSSPAESRRARQHRQDTIVVETLTIGEQGLQALLDLLRRGLQEKRGKRVNLEGAFVKILHVIFREKAVDRRGVVHMRNDLGSGLFIGMGEKMGVELRRTQEKMAPRRDRRCSDVEFISLPETYYNMSLSIGSAPDAFQTERLSRSGKLFS